MKHFILKHVTDEALLQFILCSVPLIFFVLLLYPGEALRSNSGYAIMAAQMSETNWAALSGFTAAVGLAGWLIYKPWLMFAAICLVCFFHGWVALCIWLAAPLAFGSYVYAMLAGVATLKMAVIALRYDPNKD